VDAGSSETSSGRSRTLEALLPLLVIDQPEAMAQVTDPAAFGAPFGPRGVHRDEVSFEARRYWRGPVWPQLAYLLWLAGADVAETSLRGASVSGLAEYWDADDGSGLGAIPQSWTGLASVMEG
jgi:glycogen debranching enzyme